MGNNFKGLKISGYKIFAIQALKFTSTAQIVKTKRFDEFHSSFREKTSNQLSQRRNISSRFRSKHLCYRCMEHKKKNDAFWLNFVFEWNTHLILVCKRFNGFFKRSWKCNIILVWLDSFVFQGVSKQMISSKATDVLSFTIFKWSVITSSLIKTTIRPFLNTRLKDALPPQKKQKSKTKQNKIQSLSNLRYFWIAYRFCYYERCENEQCYIIDTKMLSTTIALYFNKST